MDILVFARHPGGGIRTYIYYVYGHPNMTDHTVRLLTPKTASMASLLEGVPNCKEHIQSKESSTALLRKLWEVLRSSPPAILHSHGFTAGLLAAVPARVLGIPHVVTTHDVFLDGQFPGVVGKLKQWVIGRVLNLATAINPVGQDARQNLIESYPYLSKGTKVVGIRNGIKTSAFLTNHVRDVRSEGQVPFQALLVGFFGRFMAQKGFGLLVNAVEEWNESASRRPLHVACFGWGGFIREEQAELKKRGIDRYFHFFPSTDDMSAALRGVDAVVMPSRWEACPLLPMEAMVAGVPVVGSDCIGLREVAQDTPVLLFESGSAAGLLQRLEELDDRESELKRISAEFRPQAAQRFDVDRTVGLLRDLYEKIQ